MNQASKFAKFKADPLAYIWLKTFQAWAGTFKLFCSFYTSLLMIAKGIRFESMPCCFGIPYLSRFPSSAISIGRNFKINSSFKSNNIGMLSRSRITTNDKGAEIIIGRNVGVSAVTISAYKRIVLGDNTMIGGNVLITDSDWHQINPADRLNDTGKPMCADVVIGKNVFIGTRSIILKGVEIGDNAVIGAGSVVAKSIPPNVIAAGNPCVVIKEL